MTNTIEIENLNISDLDIPTDETLQEVASSCEDIATSSEGIATSCDNVATSCSNLAKDTTLQSTNTALGSLATDATLQATNTALGGLNTSVGGIIKDATLQATNTALSSLMADTTGQSIVSAISGLGQTLGADKANIDGSNIANPSAFRNNIDAAPTLNARIQSCTSVNANLTFGSLNTHIELNNRVCQVTGVFIVSSLIRAGSDLFDMPIGARIPTLMLVRNDSGAVYIIGTQIDSSRRIINPYHDLPAGNYRFSACYVRE